MESKQSKIKDIYHKLTMSKENYNNYLNRKNDFRELNLLSPKVINPDPGTDEYIHELDKAIRHPDGKNIAITGCYGSGKSSIVKTYREIHDKKCDKSLIISIGSFLNTTISDNKLNTREEIKTEEQDTSNQKQHPLEIRKENEIEKSNSKEVTEEDNRSLNDKEEILVEKLEKSIVKQLIYRIKYNDSKLSNIEKPQGKWRLKYSIYSIMITYIIIWLFLYNIDDKLLNAIIKRYPYIPYLVNNTLIESALILLLIVSIIIFIYFICNHIIIIIHKSKAIIRYKEQELEMNNKKNNDNFLFLDNLYEIIYVFMNSNYNTLFFEDIDRYGNDVCMKVIEDLKELNLILNECVELRKKITFVYSFRDSIFYKKEERAKFYDYVISVMPISTSYNSRLNFLTELKNKKLESSISNDLISIVSKYIIDMRMIKNIVNDYALFSKILNLNNKEKIFAMVVYKNYYYKEYDSLLETNNKINIALKEAKTNIEQELKQKAMDIEEKIENLKNMTRNNQREMKELLLYYNRNNNTLPSEIRINNQEYSIEYFLSDQFKFDLLEDRSYFFIQSRGYNLINFGKYISSENFKNIMHKYDTGIKELEEQREELKKDKEKYKNKRRKEWIQQKEDKELVEELIYKKYIEEDYIDYITSICNGNQFSGNDSRFIQSIDKKEYNYDLQLTNFSNVIEIIQEDLNSPYSLNRSLLDYLLNHKNDYSNELSSIKNQFNRLDIIQIDFLNHIKIIDNILYRKFIAVLSENFEIIWNQYYEKFILPEYNRESDECILLDIMMQKGIRKGSIKGIDSLRNIILKYGNSNTIDFINGPFVKENLLKCGIRFPSIKAVIKKDKEIRSEKNISFLTKTNLEINEEYDKELAFIVNNHLYDLTIDNLEAIVGINNPDYSTIYNSKYGRKIVDYMKKDLEAASKLYIGNDKRIANREAVRYVILNSKKDEFIKEIIRKENYILASPNNYLIDLKYLKDAYQNNRVKVDWELIKHYVTGNIVKDKVLVGIFYQNRNELLKNLSKRTLDSLPHTFINTLITSLYRGGHIPEAEKIIRNVDNDYIEKIKMISTEISSKELLSRIKYQLIEYQKTNYEIIKEKGTKEMINQFILNWYHNKGINTLKKILDNEDVKTIQNELTDEDFIELLCYRLENNINTKKEITQLIEDYYKKNKKITIPNKKKYKDVLNTFSNISIVEKNNNTVSFIINNVTK